MKKFLAALIVSTIGFAGAGQAQTAGGTVGTGILAGTSLTAGTVVGAVLALAFVAAAIGGDDGTTTTTTTTTTK